MGELTGRKIWLIKGIAEGHGRRVAQDALAQGHVVIGTTRGDRPVLTAGRGKLHVFNLDVAKEDEIRALVAREVARGGRLEIVDAEAVPLQLFYGVESAACAGPCAAFAA